jgi:hypothetical protein
MYIEDFKVETIRVPINREMNKQNVVYSYKRILLNHKRNEELVHATTMMNLEDNISSEKRQTQKDKCLIPLI